MRRGYGQFILLVIMQLSIKWPEKEKDCQWTNECWQLSVAASKNYSGMNADKQTLHKNKCAKLRNCGPLAVRQFQMAYNNIQRTLKYTTKQNLKGKENCKLWEKLQC